MVNMEIDLSQKTFITPAHLETFKKSYSGLEVRVEGKTIIDVGSLPDEQIQKVLLDLQFLERSPHIPLENLCSHLENYEPRNSTQQELLRYAKLLLELDDSTTAAGLFMYGDPGVGKSHVAVGLAKQFMKKGLEPHFSSADNLIIDTTNRLLGQAQVWIVDDLNSPYGIGMKVFKEIVLNAHERGGRIFVTSNANYHQIMENAFALDPNQKKRYMDRTEGMFKVLHVLGHSERQKTAWYRPFQVVNGGKI